MDEEEPKEVEETVEEVVQDEVAQEEVKPEAVEEVQEENVEEVKEEEASEEEEAPTVTEEESTEAVEEEATTEPTEEESKDGEPKEETEAEENIDAEPKEETEVEENKDAETTEETEAETTEEANEEKVEEPIAVDTTELSPEDKLKITKDHSINITGLFDLIDSNKNEILEPEEYSHITEYANGFNGNITRDQFDIIIADASFQKVVQTVQVPRSEALVLANKQVPELLTTMEFVMKSMNKWEAPLMPEEAYKHAKDVTEKIQPELTRILSELVKEKPSDPYKFLADAFGSL